MRADAALCRVRLSPASLDKHLWLDRRQQRRRRLLADVPRVRRLARKHLVVPRERRPLQQLRYAPVGAPPVACKQSTFEPARIARGARAPASCMPRLALLKRRHAVVGPHPTRRPASTSRAAH